jgi:hypothetical protein
MVGPPIERGGAIGLARLAEKKPEGLLQSPGAVPMTDVGGEDLPLRGSRIVKGLAHR